jgi:hypothetical protein
MHPLREGNRERKRERERGEGERESMRHQYYVCHVPACMDTWVLKHRQGIKVCVHQHGCIFSQDGNGRMWVCVWVWRVQRRESQQSKREREREREMQEETC